MCLTRPRHSLRIIFRHNKMNHKLSDKNALKHQKQHRLMEEPCFDSNSIVTNSPMRIMGVHIDASRDYSSEQRTRFWLILRQKIRRKYQLKSLKICRIMDKILFQYVKEVQIHHLEVIFGLKNFKFATN